MKTFKVEIRTVLWNDLCGKAQKVMAHSTLERAIEFIESLRPMMKKRCSDGALHFFSKDEIQATIAVAIELE